MHPGVYSSIIYNSQIMEAAQVSMIDEWIKKMWCIYIYNGMLFSHKKECNLANCNDMDGAREYNAKQNNLVRERQIPYDFTHMWNSRNKTIEQRGKKRERERNQETDS